MGEVAARNLIDHLNGGSGINPTNTIILRSELVIRESSAGRKSDLIMNKSSFVFLLLLLCCSATTKADDGYRLLASLRTGDRQPAFYNNIVTRLSFLQFN